ncbi:hypothetical protein LCGC14_1766810 [marine sediment metagenome]|uniref:Bacterial DNA polymerase III alpha subunit NTPase domain-containing protein n=1 Tax=marine sediment metagenome TaxID=412755 RepID=A0A0F9GZC5_9ZZZZ
MSLFNTELKDRTLFFDGDTVVSPDRVLEFIDKETDDIRQHNRFASKNNAIHTKTENKPLTFDWNIPEPHKSMDVVEYVLERLDDQRDNLHDTQFYTRVLRVKDELRRYEELLLFPILRVMIYIINTLQDKNIVWGVGRGSSVSSYVLYLIGVHDVDSVKYDLDFTDFLRQPDTK